MSSPKGRPAFANLENLPGAPSLGPPEPQPDPDRADRLSRHRDALDLAKLLARQRRSEIGVARPQRRFDRRGLRRIEPVVRGLSPPVRDHARLAFATIAANQPLHLPNADAQKLRGTCLWQLAPHHSPQDVKPFPLRPAPGPLPLPQKGTSQLCSKGTFQLGRNTSGEFQLPASFIWRKHCSASDCEIRAAVKQNGRISNGLRDYALFPRRNKGAVRGVNCGCTSE